MSNSDRKDLIVEKRLVSDRREISIINEEEEKEGRHTGVKVWEGKIKGVLCWYKKKVFLLSGRPVRRAEGMLAFSGA